MKDQRGQSLAGSMVTQGSPMAVRALPIQRLLAKDRRQELLASKKIEPVPVDIELAQGEDLDKRLLIPTTGGDALDNQRDSSALGVGIDSLEDGCGELSLVPGLLVQVGIPSNGLVQISQVVVDSPTLQELGDALFREG